MESLLLSSCTVLWPLHLFPHDIGILSSGRASDRLSQRAPSLSGGPEDQRRTSKTPETPKCQEVRRHSSLTQSLCLHKGHWRWDNLMSKRHVDTCVWRHSGRKCLGRRSYSVQLQTLFQWLFDAGCTEAGKHIYNWRRCLSQRVDLRYTAEKLN